MCGIMGVGTTRTINAKAFENALNSLSHRGPDDVGIYGLNVGSYPLPSNAVLDVSDNKSYRLLLGHRRLSILDLECGKQPMCDSEESLWVVYNGEIYNHEELRLILENNYKFKTKHSDTEVLIYGYKKWGTNVFTKLNGMFACCIWDKLKDILVLATDHLGKKPLYYYNKNKELFFASEIKAIISYCPELFNLNKRALNSYILKGYTEWETIFDGINLLPAGSCFIYDLQKAAFIKEKAYWSLPKNIQAEYNDSDVIPHLEELLSNAVKCRLVADVEISMLQSGGIDSSLVNYYVNRYKPAMVSYTISFPGTSVDESALANEISSALGIMNYQKSLNDISRQKVDQILLHLDEPFSDSSIIPTSQVFSEVSKYTKVAITGDGGDEFWGGYHTNLQVSKYGSIWNNIHKYKAESLFKYLQKISPSFIRYTPLSKALQVFSSGSFISSYVMNEDFLHILNDEFLSTDDIFTWELSNDDLVTQSVYYNITNGLIKDILRKVDRASMMYGVEARSPFLDIDLIEFACSVDNTKKFRGLTTKYYLRKLLEKHLGPKSFIFEKKKGFAFSLQEFIQKHISYKTCRDFNSRLINYGELKKIYMKLQNNPRLFDLIWRIYVLLLWEANAKKLEI
jgi:asparagine synthase (glutamine-hydrolysing)